MGTIFRKKQTRTIPQGATLKKSKGKTIATWSGRKGQQITSVVKTRKNGKQTVQVESPIYYAKLTGANGQEIVASTKTTDRASALKILAHLEREQDRIRAGIQTQEETDRAKLASSPLPDHLADFCKSHKVSEGHQEDTRKYLERIFSELDWKTLGDLKRSEVEGWLKDHVRGGMSARLHNAHVAAISTFGQWCERDGRILKTPFAKIKKLAEDTDPRRPRRALTEDEFSRLVAATRKAPGRRAKLGDESDTRSAIKLTAAERADLYTVLVGTGLRINELRLLTFAYVVFDDQPRIELPAKITKGKRGRTIPLRPELVAILNARPGSGDPEANVFPVPSGINRRLDYDLKRADVAKLDARNRRIDIHAMRRTFGTWLAMAGANPRLVQSIMGHQDINITMRFYVDIGIKDAFEAIRMLPNLDPGVQTQDDAAKQVATDT